ncbi:hypothetical protein EW026_g7314 [Hermanssonia centrifuga]|uniref:Uncharacterized protein n=1 Tax=Hermanssonia centrifuga TaxID=98765 RepID=A0A4S4K883_9APHY|nr:hypothetical protein EW026_g7314 [Hermanssonia centrifuga]
MTGSPGSSGLRSSPALPATRTYWEEKMYTLRQELISSPKRVGTYLGDPTLDVMTMFEWVRFDKTSVLCTVDIAANYKAAVKEFKDGGSKGDPPLPPVAAILCGVYKIDEHAFYMGPDGNWNPYKDFGDFVESKATCLLGPSAEELFNADYEILNRNIRELVEMGRSGDRRKLKGIYTDSEHGPLLKLRHVLFAELDDDELQSIEDKELNSDDDDECDIRGWPVKKKQSKIAIKKMFNKFKVLTLPAFDLVGDPIRPSKYEAVLKGADVQVHFTLLHWTIGNSKDRRSLSDTIVADLANIRVYVPPRLKPAAYAKQAKRTYERDLFTPEISPKKIRAASTT